MTESVIEIQSLSKSFIKDLPVLNALDLKISKGEFVALIGASGSGKSTLIRMIAGLDEADKKSGSIKLEGEVVQLAGKRTRKQRLMRRNVGVIFQQFNLVTRLSLFRNILIGRLGRVSAWRGTLGLFERSDKIRALQNLERVGMVDFAHQRASQLSGGQQQRGAIARVLTQQAKIILADEPIASLDPASAENVMEILSDINREDGVTVIVSLHQIDHALKHCKRIVALKCGHIVYDGPVGQITNQDLNALYGIELSESEQAKNDSALEETAIAARNQMDKIREYPATTVAH